MFGHTEIWQHVPSGELYLVRLDEDDLILDACGPVTQDEAYYTVDEAGGLFDGDVDVTDWVISNKDSFKVK